MRKRLLVVHLFLLSILVLAPSGSSAVASPEAWPTITVKELSSGLSSPVLLTHAGDNSGRAFIVQRAGQIRIWKSGALQPGAFVDISGKVLCCGEQGLLGLAFPPDFAVRKHFYVYYTNKNGDNQVSRFKVGNNPDQADPASETLILYLSHPVNTNHNGGQIAFGPDGYLYIGTGDGGGGGDPQGNAQNPASLLGKILRIDVGDRPAPIAPQMSFRFYLPLIARGSSGSNPYLIPSDNPYVGQASYRPEIWALGLRNPWRFSFDRSTGDLYIADVGQEQMEEVNFQPANNRGGQNYGWDILEGTQCFTPSTGCTPPSGYVAPVATYTHGSDNCSVTGGFVYRGSAYPALRGIYFFADFCSGKIWEMQRQNQDWQTNLTQETVPHPSSFGENQAGELFILSLDGKLYQVQTP